MQNLPAMAEIDPRWGLVLERDRHATFVYAVLSTGIYCLASCPSRRPLPKNVTFFATPLAAELAGFRACKRCKPGLEPLHPASGPVLAMCVFLENSTAPPRLGQLSAHVGLSQAHAHRLFVKATGLTPKAYHQAVVRRRLQAELRRGSSVTHAIYAAGFNAPSRFYEQVPLLLGMSPKEARSGGENSSIVFAQGECSLGSILVAATERGVCAVLLGDQPQALRHDLERRFPRAQLLRAQPSFDATVARVIALVDAHPGASAEALPLDVRGTVFQERVWRALLEIPRGTTTTYASLAASLGMPRASRAVAGACAKNPAAVLIPCHRVVAADGALSGYRWGLERKRTLLEREQTGIGPRGRPRTR